MLRSLSHTSATLSDLTIDVTDLEISTFRVVPGALVCGRTLAEISLRKNYAVTVVAIERNGKVIANPGADATLEAQDRAIVLGTPEKIADAAPLFRASPEREKKEGI
jgi:CPA2 family monovalent cation:H+ antiporter-2